MAKPESYSAKINLNVNSNEQKSLIYKLYAHGTVLPFSEKRAVIYGICNLNQVYLFNGIIVMNNKGEYSFYSESQEKIKQSGQLLGLKLSPSRTKCHPDQKAFFEMYGDKDPQNENPLEKIVE
jgi:hypothetical protein